MFENVPNRTLGKSGVTCQYISERFKTQSQMLWILPFRTKLLLRLMNWELRKERKEKKGTRRKEHFLLLLLFFFLYLSNRSRPLGDQTSTFSGPGHFLIATGDHATTKFYPVYYGQTGFGWLLEISDDLWQLSRCYHGTDSTNQTTCTWFCICWAFFCYIKYSKNAVVPPLS